VSDGGAGLRVVLIPARAPNANAYAGALRALDQRRVPRSDHSPAMVLTSVWEGVRKCEIA
jgi:hypothetical protein